MSHLYTYSPIKYILSNGDHKLRPPAARAAGSRPSVCLMYLLYLATVSLHFLPRPYTAHLAFNYLPSYFEENQNTSLLAFSHDFGQKQRLETLALEHVAPALTNSPKRAKTPICYLSLKNNTKGYLSENLEKASKRESA